LAVVADLLVAADTQAQVQEAVFFAAAHLLNLEVELLFFDITSTFFQREEMGPDAFRVYGHSKCSSRPRPGWTASSRCRPPIPTLSAADVALGYKHLLEAERAFRDLKTTLELRPVWHRLERRLRAHVLLCWLALLLVRVAERQSAQTWRRINAELGRLQLVTPSRPTGRVEQTTTLTTTQRELFTATGVAPPPRVTSLQPA
jgi:hypothetical protein